MEFHYIIMGVVALLIIVLQVLSFVGTWKRMSVFSKIFGSKQAPLNYELLKDAQGEITGFIGEGDNSGNPAFSEIKESINNYVANNESIDFQIIKGAIDANCDSREEDVQAQIPIPLYLGLAGTMAGIIIGVGSLWISGALADLVGATGTSGHAEGVVVLLGGVAIAMICSIVGLAMTTICTWRFKGCKLLIEQRKSTLLAWLQQNLLPEVATDDLQAMGLLAEQLRTFNTTFRRNTTIFGNTLESVRTTIDEMKHIVQQVQGMEELTERMAEKNARAAYRLEHSSEKLQQFNNYLDSINGYVDEVHRFTENFRDETLRLQALEEIRDFFKAHRDEMVTRQQQMSRQVAEFDRPFKSAMADLRNSMVHETEELKRIVGEHTRDFENTLREQKNLFKSVTDNMLHEFEAQARQMPQAVTAINSLRDLPEQINSLLTRVEASNNSLVRELKRALPSVVITGGGHGGEDGKDGDGGSSVGGPVPAPQPVMPAWLKWIIAVGVGLTAAACVTMCTVTCFKACSEDADEKTAAPTAKSTATAMVTTTAAPAEAVAYFPTAQPSETTDTLTAKS